jgi:hypothetical protein
MGDLASLVYGVETSLRPRRINTGRNVSISSLSFRVRCLLIQAWNIETLG